MDLAAAAGSATDLLNYGLAGLIVVIFVIPMGVYIVRDKERQLTAKDAEIARLRTELAETRKVLEPISPALTEVGVALKTAISVLGRGTP